MPEEISNILRKSVKNGAFVKTISGLFLPGSDYRHEKIMKALRYLSSFEKHDISRSRTIAFVLIKYLRIKDHEVILAALLYGALKGAPKKILRVIEVEFGHKTAMLIRLLSEDQYEGASREFAYIKLASFVCELLEATAYDSRLIEQAKKYYLPLAERHCILIHELEEAVKQLKINQMPRRRVDAKVGITISTVAPSTNSVGDVGRDIKAIRIAEGQKLPLINAHNRQLVEISLAMDHEVMLIPNPFGDGELWRVIDGTEIGDTESDFRKKCQEHGIEMLG